MHFWKKIPPMFMRFKKTLLLIVLIIFITATFFYYEEQARISRFLLELDPDMHLSNYTLQLTPIGACQKGIKIVIIVVSSCKNFKSREDIRRTWGKEAHNTYIQRYFIIGAAPAYLEPKIQSESQKHNDIIRYNFVDSYLNLTLKSISMLRWVDDQCKNTEYVVKIDDDVFLNVTLLKKLIADNGSDLLLTGDAITGNKRFRKEIDRFYVPPAEFPGEVYPAYLSGGCYVMSRNVAIKLLSASRLARFLRLEDVFITGVCREIAGLSLSHCDDFLIIDPKYGPCFKWNVITMVIYAEFKHDMYAFYEKRKHCPYNSDVT